MKRNEKVGRNVQRQRNEGQKPDSQLVGQPIRELLCELSKDEEILKKYKIVVKSRITQFDFLKLWGEIKFFIIDLRQF